MISFYDVSLLSLSLALIAVPTIQLIKILSLSHYLTPFCCTTYFHLVMVLVVLVVLVAVAIVVAVAVVVVVVARDRERVEREQHQGGRRRGGHGRQRGGDRPVSQLRMFLPAEQRDHQGTCTCTHALTHHDLHHPI